MSEASLWQKARTVSVARDIGGVKACSRQADERAVVWMVACIVVLWRDCTRGHPWPRPFGRQRRYQSFLTIGEPETFESSKHTAVSQIKKATLKNRVAFFIWWRRRHRCLSFNLLKNKKLYKSNIWFCYHWCY